MSRSITGELHVKSSFYAFFYLHLFIWERMHTWRSKDTCESHFCPSILWIKQHQAWWQALPLSEPDCQYLQFFLKLFWWSFFLKLYISYPILHSETQSNGDKLISCWVIFQATEICSGHRFIPMPTTVISPKCTVRLPSRLNSSTSHIARVSWAIMWSRLWLGLNSKREYEVFQPRSYIKCILT